MTPQYRRNYTVKCEKNSHNCVEENCKRKRDISLWIQRNECGAVRYPRRFGINRIDDVIRSNQSCEMCIECITITPQSGHKSYLLGYVAHQSAPYMWQDTCTIQVLTLPYTLMCKIMYFVVVSIFSCSEICTKPVVDSYVAKLFYVCKIHKN